MKPNKKGILTIRLKDTSEVRRALRYLKSVAIEDEIQHWRDRPGSETLAAWIHIQTQFPCYPSEAKESEDS